MTRGIFVTERINESKIRLLEKLGVNAVFVNRKNISLSGIKRLRGSSIKVFIEIGVFTGGACPNHQQVRRDKLGEVKEVMERLNPDGIWLDFIRFPCHWEVPRPDLTEFSEDDWTDRKCPQITNFVEKTKRIVKKANRDALLGIFTVPWRKQDYKGAIQKVIGQDFSALARHADVFSPMTYHRMCGRPVGWIADIVRYMNKVTGKIVLPIIQTENKPAKFGSQELERAIKSAFQSSSGVVIFFLEDLLKDKDKLNAWKSF